MSLSVDELTEQMPIQSSQNWLLTYIDVFVLVVMLFVTLVALSHFEPIQTANKKTHPTKIPEKKSLPSIVQTTSQTKTIIGKQNPDNNTITSRQLVTSAKKVVLPEKPKHHINVEKNIAPLAQKELQKSANEKHTLINETDIQQQLSKQLEELGLQDSINMKVTRGYAQLEIQDNILYQSSEAQLTTSGQSILKRLTPLLQQSTGLIYIEGHTDNRPIKTRQFPSNWELGAARATSVLHFLASQHIESSRMRAVTYADTQPIADNTTKQGRQKNRRVNIIIKVSDRMN